MNVKKPLVVISAGAALIVSYPAVAVGHSAEVICDQQTGQIVVTPDYLQYNPAWTIDDTNVTVRWTDGFVRRYPIPEACEAPPTPTPVPPVPEIIPPPPVVVPPPPVVVVPLTCADLLRKYPKAGKKRQRDWGCVVLPGPDRPKRKITKRYYPCVVNGRRAKTVITVTLPSGKRGTVTKWGKPCKRYPAVTG